MSTRGSCRWHSSGSIRLFGGCSCRMSPGGTSCSRLRPSSSSLPRRSHKKLGKCTWSSPTNSPCTLGCCGHRCRLRLGINRSTLPGIHSTMIRTRCTGSQQVHSTVGKTHGTNRSVRRYLCTCGSDMSSHIECGLVLSPSSSSGTGINWVRNRFCSFLSTGSTGDPPHYCSIHWGSFSHSSRSTDRNHFSSAGKHRNSSIAHSSACIFYTPDSLSPRTSPSHTGSHTRLGTQ